MAGAQDNGRDQAQERTDALSQIAGGMSTSADGFVRMLAAEIRQGTHKALGMSRDEWLQAVDSSRLRYTLTGDGDRRREVVAMLTAPVEEGGEGLSNRAAADVLDVDEGTVRNDIAEDSAPDEPDPAAEAAPDEPTAEDSAPDEPEGTEADAAIVQRAERANVDWQRKRGESLLANLRRAVLELDTERSYVVDAVRHGDQEKHRRGLTRCSEVLAALTAELDRNKEIRAV